jgi:protein gp37
MRDARRMEKNPSPKVSEVYSGLVLRQGNGILNWTGVVKVLPERLDWPAHWKEHRDVFVCSQSDLFHEDVPYEFIGRVFSAMWNYSWHTYYILTKRPERLLALLENDPPEGLRDFNSTNFPHVVVGISAEDQAAAEERMPLLVRVPLASTQRFVSAEPLIGAVDLTRWIHQIGWVIAGGESGSHARPMHPNWARSLRDQCDEAGVAYHFKQWGEFAPEAIAHERQLVAFQDHDTTLYRAGLPKAGSKTPSITMQEDDTRLYRIGRKKAGRVLDSQYWNARPGDDYGPTDAPHPLGTEVTITDAGEEYNGLVAVVSTIQPDNPEDKEFGGEEAAYYVSIDGREIEQAFSYWQLQPEAQS